MDYLVHTLAMNTWVFREINSHKKSKSRVFLTFWLSLVFLTQSRAVFILHGGVSLFPTPISPDKEDVQIFTGNKTVSNHFHQIYLDDDFLLIGARNFVYNVSLLTFIENERFVWFSQPNDVTSCLLKQKTPEECQNYIRVIIKESKDRYLICGTNAFRPSCRSYSTTPFQKQDCSSFNEAFGYCEESGVARCPYDPTHNSTAVFTGGRLYSATVADVSSRDSLIFSSPLRTEQHDSQWLNEPDFVSSFSFEDKVYFFFREIAIENINCGKAVFSRVARVCTNDRGGDRVLRNTWTSFFKARLNCSIPGEFPFYFDEIQSTTELGDGSVFPTIVLTDRVSMVYGVFTTPRNGLRGSAICAFRLSDIISTFEGPFKEQKTAYSNWLPVREADVPNPHPGKSCRNDTSTISDQMLNFIKWHPLMDRAVPAFGGQPIIVQTSFNFSFTTVAVDWQVYAADHRYYDVLFVGTDDGHVLKIINRGRGQAMEMVIVEQLTVFPDRVPVTNLRIHRKTRRLVITSKNEIRSVALQRCRLQTSCSSCIALKDPYCSWLNNECLDSDLGMVSIETGRHAKCSPQDPSVYSSTTQQLPSPSPAPPLHRCHPCSCAVPTSSGILTNPEAAVTSKVPLLLPNSSGQSLVSDGSGEQDAIFQEVREDCQEELGMSTTSSYSSSTVALTAILSILFSLLTGAAVGFYIGIKRHSTIYRLKNKDSSSLSFGRQTEKVQNPYEIDSHRHSCTERCASRSDHKQCNVFINELKKNNVVGLSNGSIVTSFDSKSNAVYL